MIINDTNNNKFVVTTLLNNVKKSKKNQLELKNVYMILIAKLTTDLESFGK